jgi:hypothetical protein
LFYCERQYKKEYLNRQMGYSRRYREGKINWKTQTEKRNVDLKLKKKHPTV